jgi:hypothetical protein
VKQSGRFAMHATRHERVQGSEEEEAHPHRNWTETIYSC